MADDSNASPRQAQDIRPVPDPTVLTTQASDRLESMLRNLIWTEIRHRAELTDKTFEGVEQRIADLDERIADQFTALAARTAEQKADTTKALTDALAAQKEAAAATTTSSEKSITKSETATTERIKATESLLSTTTKASDDKIIDLKGRMDRMEASRVGSREGVAGVHESSSRTLAILAGLASLVLVVVAIITVALLISNGGHSATTTPITVVVPTATP